MNLMLEEEKAHQLAHFTIETAFDPIFWIDSKARVQWVRLHAGASGMKRKPFFR